MAEFLSDGRQCFLRLCSNNMSGKKGKRAPSDETFEVITEPRFAKAHTDRRFAKIAHKDKAIQLDSRFKAIVEDRKFAIACTYPRSSTSFAETALPNFR